MWITQCIIVENVENVNNVDKYIFLTTLIHRSSNITFSAFFRLEPTEDIIDSNFPFYNLIFF